MTKRFSYKKITEGDFAKCWYCSRETYFALTNKKTGEEVWACFDCALKVGKVKRLKKKIGHNTKEQEKHNSKPNFLIKKIENSIPEAREGVLK